MAPVHLSHQPQLMLGSQTFPAMSDKPVEAKAKQRKKPILIMQRRFTIYFRGVLNFVFFLDMIFLGNKHLVSVKAKYSCFMCYQLNNVLNLCTHFPPSII